MAAPTRPPRVLPGWLAPVADAVCLVAFVALGRQEHGSLGTGLGGLAGALWPFLAGWFGVALAVQLYRRPLAWNRWAVTLAGGVVVGMVLRIVFMGHSFVLIFVVITAGVLAAFTAGWRGIARIVTGA